MKFKDHLTIILRNNRASMRDCALAYRDNRRRGNVTFMVRWLILAAEYRRLNRELQEAA